MRVTVREHLYVNIEGIEDNELTAFLAMFAELALKSVGCGCQLSRQLKTHL